MKNQELFITMPSGRVFRAVIRSHHVALQDGADNSELFTGLGICDKLSFCQQAYGYRPLKGNWPWFREGDYAALKRLLKALCDRGCTITYTGQKQTKHVSKPVTYSNACVQTPCGGSPCGESPCGQVSATDVTLCGYKPTFKSPLLGLTPLSW